MLCKAYPLGTLGQYKYVVILSQARGKILLSRHRQRMTWETQGGHIEPGESCEQAARRELFEESGARRYALRPLCDYRAWDEQTGAGANGQVFAARIAELGPMPESEMAETRCFDVLPDNLTYPAITPVLFERLRADEREEAVLLGTTNPAKVRYFETLLCGLGLRFTTPDALGIAEEPPETGRTPEENARIKAALYGQYARRAVCADSGLYFDALALDDARQPGLHIRTPGGCARLDDGQMIEHYAALAGALGGRALAYYLDGTAVCTDGRVSGFSATREEARAGGFLLTDEADARRVPGWPLDSLSRRLDGTSFLDAARESSGDIRAPYRARLRAFLEEALR